MWSHSKMSLQFGLSANVVVIWSYKENTIFTTHSLEQAVFGESQWWYKYYILGGYDNIGYSCDLMAS